MSTIPATSVAKEQKARNLDRDRMSAMLDRPSNGMDLVCRHWFQNIYGIHPASFRVAYTGDLGCWRVASYTQ